MGELIGIMGAIGSGKTTVAGFLCQLEPDHAAYETSQLIAEVADDFNRALSGELAFEAPTSDVELSNQALIWLVESVNERLHHDTTWTKLAVNPRDVAARPELYQKLFDYLALVRQQPALLEASITAENKAAYRPLLQWLGGYLVAKLSDTIWYNELFQRIGLYDATKNLVLIGGVRYPADAAVVHANGGIVLLIRRPATEAAIDARDVTETSRHLVKPDITLINNGTLEELQAAVEKLWDDLSVAKAAKRYQATPQNTASS